MVCVRMRIIRIDGCQDCPNLTMFGCGYDCYYCEADGLLEALGVTIKRLNRTEVEKSKYYLPGWCVLDED